MTTRARPSPQVGNLADGVTNFVGRRRETAHAVRLVRTASARSGSSCSRYYRCRSRIRTG